MLENTPAWLKALAAFITAVGGVVAIVFQHKNRKASESKHATSFQQAAVRDAQVDRIINLIVAAVPHCKVASVAQWKNGDLPKEFRLLRSTDFNTWSVWRDYKIAEDNLVKVQAATLDEGHCLFRAAQMEDETTREWYEANHLLQTTSLLIGVNDIKNESIVLYINFDMEHIVSPESRKLIRFYVSELHELYKPQGWFAKKNYLK
jgi:hypothetical protein